MSDDPFRYCVHCNADCYEDEPDHADSCPSRTGVWPVTEQVLGMRGPNDPYAHGMRCGECESEFSLGDHYTHKLIEDGEVPIYESICLGCAAQIALSES